MTRVVALPHKLAAYYHIDMYSSLVNGGPQTKYETGPYGLHFWFESRWNLSWTNWPIYGTTLRGRQIKPWVSHTITGIKGNIRRAGSPGVITLYLYTCDGSGYPDSFLASSIISGDALDTSYALTLFDFGGGASLTAGTLYCFYLDASSGDSSNKIEWEGVAYGYGDKAYNATKHIYDLGSGWGATFVTGAFVFEEVATI